MPTPFDPDTRQKLHAELHALLDNATIQALRQAARVWDWPLRGTAKLDVVNQVAGYLGDSVRMAEDILTLPEEAREILGWLAALYLAGEPSRALQQVLALVSGRQMTQKAIKQHIANLQERCLIFVSAENQYFTPALFREWLPPLAAPQLRHPGEPTTGVPFTLSALNQHVQHLVSSIEADQPAAAAQPPAAGATYSPMERFSAPMAPRPGPVAPDILARWGYLTGDERSLAAFLLEQIIAAGLCTVDPHGGSQRLKVAPAVSEAWDVLSAGERLNLLQTRWHTPAPRRQPGALSFWNELDLALTRIRAYSLRATYFWNPTESLFAGMVALRAWLLAIVRALAPDVWYSIERLGELVYQLHRDLFAWEGMPVTWRWYTDKTPLDPQQMTLEVWQATYGQIIEAWIAGPLSWLLYAQAGYAGSRPVAFRMLSGPLPGADTAIPANSLRFSGREIALLQNSWQTGELRQLLRRIATETARDAATTTYRLDTHTFRRTLHAGQTAAELIQAFAQSGFPLPQDTAALLQAWQARAGRHQLYDHVAVIEFNETLHPEEARAIAGLGMGQFYQASPHCLVVLNPDNVPGIIETLRRRGYTPQVLP